MQLALEHLLTIALLLFTIMTGYPHLGHLLDDDTLCLITGSLTESPNCLVAFLDLTTCCTNTFLGALFLVICCERTTCERLRPQQDIIIIPSKTLIANKTTLSHYVCGTNVLSGFTFSSKSRHLHINNGSNSTSAIFLFLVWEISPAIGPSPS